SLRYFDGQSVGGQDFAKLFDGKIQGQKYELTGIAEFDRVITARNSGQGVAEYYGAGGKEWNRLAAYYRGLIESGLLKPIEFGFESVSEITADELDNLYRLIDEGRLDEATQRQVQGIIDQYNL